MCLWSSQPCSHSRRPSATHNVAQTVRLN
uniref:Uncharacterized protein n=1 Tax=Anguilla anguilla TaxID=7936 RepID=A0A0E9REW7_ANGAN